MRILFLTPNQSTRWNPQHDLFRRAIGRQHEVVYVGPGYEHYGIEGSPTQYNVPKIMSRYKPFDLVMTYGLKYTWQFHGLEKVKIPKVHFLCDFLPAIPGKFNGTLKAYWELLDRDQYDFFFCLSYQARRLLMHNGIVLERIGLLPFGIDQDIYDFSDIGMKDRKWDVNASYSQHDVVYPGRKEITVALDYLNSINALKAFTARTFNDSYIKVLQNSKIAVAVMNHWGIMNTRVLEAMACGAILFTNDFEERKHMGFEDNKHLVLYNSLEDLKHKLLNFIDLPNVLQALATEARKKVVAWHSNDHRVRQMTDILEVWM